MNLAQPDAVEPPGFDRVHGLEALAERVGLTQPRPGLLYENAEVHGGGKSSAEAGTLQGGFPDPCRVLLSRRFPLRPEEDDNHAAVPALYRR